MKNNNSFKIYKLVLSIAFILFLLIGSVSCDPCLFSMIHVTEVKTPTGELDITEIRDGIGMGRNFLQIILKGDGYEINPDSLKLVADNKNYHINYYVFKTNQHYKFDDKWPYVKNLISNRCHVGNDTIYVSFKAHSIFVKDRNKDFEESPVYHILPCDFIKYNSDSIINDTITIRICKCPIIHINQL